MEAQKDATKPRKGKSSYKLQANLDRESELRRNQQHVKELHTAKSQAHWAVKSEAKMFRARKHRDAEAERIELEMINTELREQRSARLAELYQQLDRSYEPELNALGLSFLHDRA